MNKLETFVQSKQDLDFAFSETKKLDDVLDNLNPIVIGSNITCTSSSSAKQFAYGLGILNAQISAYEELGMPNSEPHEKKEALLAMFKIRQEHDAWRTYRNELQTYCCELRKLLSKEELFELLEKPVKP